MAERLILVLMDVRFMSATLVGWQSKRLNARLKDIWSPAVTSGHLSPKQIETLLQMALAARRDDIVNALGKVGVRNPSTSLREQKALQNGVVGEYHLLDQIRIQATVILKADGKFKYSMVNDGQESQKEGYWVVRNGLVMFSTDRRGPTLFKRMNVKGESLPKLDRPGRLYVYVFSGKNYVNSIGINAVGCEPGEMSSGTSSYNGEPLWVNGKICQIVLQGDNVNNGKAFVYAVPTETDPVLSRHFSFAIQPPMRESDIDFNLEIHAENNELVLNRMGQEYHFARQ